MKIENLSLGQNSTQSTTLSPYDAVNGVDGCFTQTVGSGCCTHTLPNDTEAFWQVDLGTIATISNITNYFQDDTDDDARARIAGYQLYVSITTNWRTGVLCYQDNSGDIAEVKLIQNHQCRYVGRYVTININRESRKPYDWYSDDAVIGVCEVQVFGCPTGNYGIGTCNQKCSLKCYGGNCDASSGYCFYCRTGTWGESCQDDCSPACDEGCHQHNGLCKGCKQRKHGSMCDLDCPTNCKGDCHQNSGFCKDCITGKTGDMCDDDCADHCQECYQSGSCKECRQGRYGHDCELVCPGLCSNGRCDRDAGTCDICKPGKYGIKCDFDCPKTCQDLKCEKSSGICYKCKPGYYGHNCELACAGQCNDGRCHRDNGSCGDCKPGKYDTNCDLNCTQTCKDIHCAKSSGFCDGCTRGKYGNKCNLNCPKTCKDIHCEQRSGSCAGCITTKYGYYCNRTCPDGCEKCSQYYGTCEDDPTVTNLAVSLGVFVVAFLIALVFICRERRK
ncbi:cell death abnormality protein 1-like [Argopecten irradians]|uniref:cell death abnormality protein 1-like n=1 Tax=Argopecten irradians TaxID=31199 RepID=UPI00371BAFB2